VEMQWLMLQQNSPKDYVIATGNQCSVREFLEAAAAILDIKLTWKGSGSKECGYDQDGNCIVRVDDRYYRPTEVDTLLGDSSKAFKDLGWQPRFGFQELVEDMVASDLKLAEKELLISQNDAQ